MSIPEINTSDKNEFTSFVQKRINSKYDKKVLFVESLGGQVVARLTDEEKLDEFLFLLENNGYSPTGTVEKDGDIYYFV